MVTTPARPPGRSAGASKRAGRDAGDGGGDGGRRRSRRPARRRPSRSSCRSVTEPASTATPPPARPAPKAAARVDDPAAAHAPSIVGARCRAPGSVSRNDLPGRPARWSSTSSPSIRCASSLAIARPRPEPSPPVGPRKNRSNSRSAVRRVDRRPVVGARPARRCRPPRARVTVTSTPGGLWRSALSTSTRAICATRASSAIATADDAPAARDRAAALLGAWRRSPAPRSAATPAMSTSSRAHLHAAGVEARQVEQVGGEPGQPRHLAVHRGDELAARGGILLVLEQLEEAAEREQRRAQLVRGVGDELAARPVGALQPAAHVVERAGQLVDLVAAVVGDRRREVAGGDAARRALQPADARGQRERGQQPDQPARGQRDGDRDQHVALHRVDRAVDVVRATT